jgi:hypothetical protein
MDVAEIYTSDISIMVWSVNYHTMTLLHTDAMLVASASKYANVRTNNGFDSHNKTNKNTNVKVIFFYTKPIRTPKCFDLSWSSSGVT